VTFYITARSFNNRQAIKWDISFTSPAITVSLGCYDITDITAVFDTNVSDDRLTPSSVAGELFSILINDGSIVL